LAISDLPGLKERDLTHILIDYFDGSRLRHPFLSLAEIMHISAFEETTGHTI
jgi:hypothetical protein